jgi:hypothetical protein
LNYQHYVAVAWFGAFPLSNFFCSCDLNNRRRARITGTTRKPERLNSLATGKLGKRQNSWNCRQDWTKLERMANLEKDRTSGTTGKLEIRPNSWKDRES